MRSTTDASERYVVFSSSGSSPTKTYTSKQIPNQWEGLFRKGDSNDMSSECRLKGSQKWRCTGLRNERVAAKGWPSRMNSRPWNSHRARKKRPLCRQHNQRGSKSIEEADADSFRFRCFSSRYFRMMWNLWQIQGLFIVVFPSCSLALNDLHWLETYWLFIF